MVEQDCSNVSWMYFDSSQAKWNAYNDNDQETIFAAYKRGDNVVKLSSSRRKYTVYLSKMIQINDESQNRRPIMMKWMPRNKVEEGEKLDQAVLASGMLGTLRKPLGINELRAFLDEQIPMK